MDAFLWYPERSALGWWTVEFSEWCKSYGIRHCLSSAYNPQSNGSAEKGVGQIKSLLEKMWRKKVLNQDELNGWVFKLNSLVTSGQGSALQRFFGRNVGTYQMELFKKKIDHAKLIAKRSEMQQKTAEKLGRRSKDQFKVGDKVLCQNMKTMKWTIRGEVVESREAEDRSVRSFIVKTERGRSTLRNSRHLKFQIPVKKVSFAELSNEGEETAEMASDYDETAGIELETEQPRESARLAERTGSML